MKLNNRGFAITTVLYGTLILFLMLLTSMLGILSTHKVRMEKLIEEEHGARDIIESGPESSGPSSIPSIENCSIQNCSKTEIRDGGCYCSSCNLHYYKANHDTECKKLKWKYVLDFQCNGASAWTNASGYVFDDKNSAQNACKVASETVCSGSKANLFKYSCSTYEEG